TAVIERVRAAPVAKEIIAIDDCSTDRTPELLRSIPGIIVLRHPVNRGKGAAVRTGLERATGDVVLIQDADFEYDPADYPRLLAPFADPRIDAVFGSRFRGHGRFLILSRLANLLLTFLTDVLFGGRITDMETGYKAVRRETLLGLGLRAERFDIEPEIACRLLRRRLRIVEVPISYSARSEGKKIGPRDAVQAVCRLLHLYAA
ncbi:MAG: glycosyltransferase family 2 protein, partial [candidate division WOR-3 bacterium]